MKRDMNLIREMLIDIETKATREEPLFASDFCEANTRRKETWTIPQCAEHMRLLSEAGFIEFDDCRTIDGQVDDAYAIRITWVGHEFIANIHNDKVWAKVKKSLLKLGAGASADLVKALAAKAAADVLGL